MSGTELTNQLKGNRNRGKPFVGEEKSRCRETAKANHKGWRTKNFICISHCLAMLAGSVKKHAFFSNNPSLSENQNSPEQWGSQSANRIRSP